MSREGGVALLDPELEYLSWRRWPTGFMHGVPWRQQVRDATGRGYRMAIYLFKLRPIIFCKVK